MAEILLPSGLVALIDDEDLPLTAQFKWYSDKRDTTTYVRGYSATETSAVYLHRVVMQGKFVDHKNGNGLDNRKSNLRPCTRGQNNKNSIKKREGKKYKGVYYDKTSGKWYSQLYSNKKFFSGGRTNTEVESAENYNAMAILHHGEFAKLNLIPANDNSDPAQAGAA